MPLSRRQFLEAAAASAAAASPLAAAAGAATADAIPRRAFGKTGLDVSAIGFGSGSRFLMYKDDDQALDVLNRAIDLGVTYIDTAHSYGDGKSEERIGRLMPTRRKDVTLATKVPGRKADDVKRQIELSLKRLRTDRLDVIHLHALSDENDLAAAEAGGAFKALFDARDQKITRAVGITCHASPTALKAALERHDFDATQMALNAALARMANVPGGMKATRVPEASFEALALPVAVRKNMGVIAMKVFGQDQLAGAAGFDQLLRYALSLPVSLASLGMPKPEFLDRNVAVAKAFTPMSPAERKALNDSIAASRKVAMADFLRDHADA